jgi:hypothetical protein
MIYNAKKDKYEFTMITNKDWAEWRIAISSNLGGVSNHMGDKKSDIDSALEPATSVIQTESASRLFLPVIMR